MSLKVWPKYRFKRANARIRDCLLDLGYCATEEEMEERKEFIRLCREVVKETETVGKYPLNKILRCPDCGEIHNPNMVCLKYPIKENQHG